MTKIKKEETKITVITNSMANGKNTRVNLRLVNRALFLLIVIFGVYYIIGANDLTVKGFTVMNLKKQLDQVSSENMNLQSRIINMDSYTDIDKEIQDLGMVSVNNMKYVEAGAGMVARR